MKIGIIGNESSHANAFADILRKMDIEPIIDDDLKISADLDGVMITTRDGNTHKSLALPFIKAGIPIWIDKPFTTDFAEAKEIIAAVKSGGTLITGGSTCKFAPDILGLANDVKNGEFGEIRSAMLNFPVMLDSPHNGIHFYAHHLVEMTLAVFGYDLRAVWAFEKNGGIACLARYDRFDAIMNFQPDVWDGYVTILGTKVQIVRKLELSSIYKDGVRAFVKMLETRSEPVSRDNLIFPVKVVNAIEKSYMESIEVNLQILQEVPL